MALSKISGTTGIADATITSAKLADFTAAVDLNGVELLLDADADTSISADTDDQIDIKIANADHLKILSSSGDTVLKPMVDGKDIIFQQFDGNKIFCIDDGNFVSVGGNATAAGQIRIYEDTDNGSHYSGFTVGNLTASVAYQLPNADGSSGQALITDGSGVLSFTTLSANTPSSADGQALGSASLEWSDLFLADAGTIQFGADQDVTLTHVADTGLLLSATDQLQFGDSGTFIHQSADGVLDLVSDTEIELNATTIDVNGNLDVSGTITSAGIVTGTGFTAGSAVLAEAELELLDGLTAGTAIASKVVTTDANIDTSGQRNLTISGELDAATGDFSGAITSGGVITGTAFTAGSAVLAEAELELLDGLTAGTAIASKVVTTDANIDTTGQRNLTISGELDAATGDFSGAVDVAGTTTVVALTASGLVTAGAKIDLNGTELILDADGDTSLTADTDDQIHIRIAGADDFKFIANHFNVLSGSNVTFANNSVAYFGDGNNLQISSDGTNALIAESGGSGNLNIAGQTVRLMNAANDEIMLEATNDGGVDIRHNNVTKLVTISSGVTITGDAGATTLNGIPFFAADNSIYTHNVSGTDDTASFNAAYGITALDAITTGDDNVAVGFAALTALTTGLRNIAIGRQAADEFDTENDNLAIGRSALGGAVAGGEFNVAIGNETLLQLTSGDKNTVVGYQAGKTISSGGTNVIIGHQAMDTATTPANGVFIGNNVGGEATTTGNQNNIVGAESGLALTSGGSNMVFGPFAFQANTTGSRNMVMGSDALRYPDTENDNIAIGHAAMSSDSLAGGEFNVAIGTNALDALTSGDNNIAIGYEAAGALSTGGENIIMGSYAVSTGVLTGAGNVAIGRLAGQDLTSAAGNVIIGRSAAQQATTSDGNVIIGDGAVQVGVLTGNDNVVIGQGAGVDLTSAAQNVIIGEQSGAQITTASENVYIGHKAAGTGIGTSSYNIAIGNEAAEAATTMSESVSIGYRAAEANTTGSNVIAIGYTAYDNADTENHNLAIGTHALGGPVNGGENNVAVGNYSLDAITSGDGNVAVGYQAGTEITTGAHNTLMGREAGVGITTGDYNVAIGEDNMTASCTGDYNHIIGRDSGKAITSGVNNLAIGGAAGYAITEGHDNIALGHDGGRVYTTGDHNISIGYKSSGSGVDVSNEILIGHGAGSSNFVAGGTGTVRLGMYNNHITNTFTSNANWAHSSDERWKKNIADNPIGLDFINDLRTVTYNWKAFSEIDPSLSEYNAEETKYIHPEIQHGLIAQEVKAALDKNGIDQFAGWYEDQGHADKQQGISESMYVMPLIKAVQELSSQVEELKDKIKVLEE